jgi:hypothetical protein
VHENFSKLVEQVEKRRAEKVAKFLELLCDPDIAPYIDLLRNGKEPEKPKGEFIPPAGFKVGNGIREAVINLDLPSQFTSKDILAGLGVCRA